MVGAAARAGNSVARVLRTIGYAIIAVLVFIPILLFRRDKLVPFGIFLALGAAVTWLVGTDIIGWYRGMVGI